jgi:hypothetical protein
MINLNGFNQEQRSKRPRLPRIIRYLGHYPKKTCSPIAGRVDTKYEFALVMKFIRDWVRVELKGEGAYAGVLERGLYGKVHYHGIIWKTRFNKPYPLFPSEIEDLRKIIHSRIQIFRELEAKKGAEKARVLTLLRKKHPDANLKGVGNPFYLVQLKKKGIPLNWGSRAARYVFKSMLEDEHRDEFIASSGIAAALRHIESIYTDSVENSQTEVDYWPILKRKVGTFNMKTVALLVNAVVEDLDKGIEFSTIAHRWFWKTVLIRYDGLKLKNNTLALLAIAILYSVLKARRPLNKMNFEPYRDEKNLILLLTNCHRVLSRCPRWWSKHHPDTLAELIYQVRAKRQQLKKSIVEKESEKKEVVVRKDTLDNFTY